MGRVVGGVALCLALSLAAVGYGYASNHPFAYHGGLWVLILGLVFGAFLGMRGKRAVGLARLSLALASLLLAMEAVELAWILQQRLSTTTPAPALYSYDAARANRAAFLRWWNAHLRRWARLDENLVMPDPTGRNRYVLIPGATIVRHDSEIHINQRGFRGKEISPDEEDRFRIVALGESTTFGLTMQASDRTWSVALEERIARTLQCERPVEVINAGVPGWTLANQVKRLEVDVLPLRPGLIVSYFGYNGFSPFFRGVPSPGASASPSTSMPGSFRCSGPIPGCAARSADDGG